MGSKGDWSWIPIEAVNRGLSVPQLAQLLDVEPQTVHYWIHGRNDPQFPNALRLAGDLFFGGSVEQLAERAGFDRVSLLREIVAQMGGLEVKPGLSGWSSSLATIPLHLPMEIFQPGDDDVVKQAVQLAKGINNLLRRTGAYRALQAQAYALITQFMGRRDGLAAQMWYDLAYAELMLGHYPQAAEAAEEVRHALGRQHDLTLLADSHWLSGECLRIMGDLAEAHRHCEEAEKLYRRANVPFHAAGPMWVAWILARIATAAGYYDRAMEHFEDMREMARRGGHRDGEMLVTWGTAYIHELQSDLRRALASYQQVQRISRQLDDPYWEATAAWRIAEIKRKQGRLDETQVIAESARTTFDVIGNPNMSALLSCTLAASDVHTGQFDHGLALYTGATHRFAEDGDRPMERAARAGSRLAQLAQKSMKLLPNYRRLMPARDRAPEALVESNRYFETHAALANAEILRLSGYPVEAYEQYAAVARLSAASGHRLEYAHALLSMAESKRLLGQADRTPIQDSLRIYRALESPWGQAHALIAQALADWDGHSLSSNALWEAATLARRASLPVEVALIEALSMDAGAAASQPQHRHALIFV